MRDLRSIELFILAMVRAGVNSVYGLQSVAGVSAGTSVPVLKQLTTRGYVLRPHRRSRRRLEFEITEEGKTALKANYRSLLHRDVLDFDEVLRLFWVATVFGDRESLFFLEHSARLRRSRGKEMIRQADQMRQDGETTEREARDVPAVRFQRLRLLLGGRRLESEAEVLEREAELVRSQLHSQIEGGHGGLQQAF